MSKASLSHFKLTVEDSVKLARFYRDVFGMKEVERFDALDADDPHLEIHLSAGREEDDNKIALVHYSNRPAPTPGEATIGFIVEDVDAVVAARFVARAGGNMHNAKLPGNQGI